MNLFKVNTPSGIVLRDSPGLNNNRIGIVFNNQQFEKNNELVINNDIWANITTDYNQNGWILTSENNNDLISPLTIENNIAPLINPPEGGVDTITTDSPPETPIGTGETPATTVVEDSNEGYLSEGNVEEYFKSNLQTVSNSTFSKITSVLATFGLPYQFLPDTDMRLDRSDSIDSVGISYADRIISKTPIVFLAPGRPAFMTKFNKSTTEKVLGILSGAGITDGGGSMSDALQGKNGRYYTFQYANVEYYNYVNPACRLASILYKVNDYEIPSKGGGKIRIQNVDWGSYTRQNLDFFDMNINFQSVPFYVDSDNSVSESFSTSTTQSSLANTINSVSDMGRELGFLLGYGSSALGKAIDSDETIREALNNINGKITDALGSGNFLSNLTSHLKTVATGGKLLFPEIWQDSSFSKSYDIKIKLVSPNCNRVSIFLNIIVPIIHLMCMVAPQSTDDNPNGYHSPFLVRGIYKGMWNVDTGIITSMNIDRGADAQWTPDGVPTTAEVSLTIKDLYETALTITPGLGTGGSLTYNTMSNTALMDYLSNLTGTNIYEPEITRQIAMIAAQAGSLPGQFVGNIWTNVQSKVVSNIASIFRGY